MNKNDRLIAIAGVVVLIIASVGVFTWRADESFEQMVRINQFFTIGSMAAAGPDAIMVCDSSPFYALIATPIALSYDMNGLQHVRPLYILNSENPSRAVTRAVDQIGQRVSLYIDNSYSPEEWSVMLARQCWTQSDAALLIPANESGYNLGVIATPLASYLNIPVIVTDGINQSVTQVFSELGVKQTIVCGEQLMGYGEVLRFTCVEDIIDAEISLVRE
ncbi:MAG: hypothetical protein KKG04_10110, partial [Candidatus Thermoplasmatota archaeon]|nr:hypothetical protein [Candidatus Thermoplasmatota archaeon]